MKEENLNINGVNINYIHGGSGKKLLMFPGWPSNFTADDKTLNFFSKYFEVYGVNIPGFGKSSPVLGKPSLDKLMEVINIFINKMNIHTFYLIGFSFGGMIALELASMKKEKIIKAIIVAPLIKFGYFKFRFRFIILSLLFLRKIFPGITKLISGILNNDDTLRKFYFLVTNYHYKGDGVDDYKNNVLNMKSMNPDSCLDICSFLPNVNLRDDLTKISSEILLLIGEKDDFLIDYSQNIKDLFKNSEILKVNTEHWNIIPEYGEDNLVKFFLK